MTTIYSRAKISKQAFRPPFKLSGFFGACLGSLFCLVASTNGAHANECSDTIAGAEQGPDPNFRSWLFGDACYVVWPSGDGAIRNRYERECRSMPGFLHFEGDTGAGRNTCVFRAERDGSDSGSDSDFDRTEASPSGSAAEAKQLSDLAMAAYRNRDFMKAFPLFDKAAMMYKDLSRATKSKSEANTLSSYFSYNLCMNAISHYLSPEAKIKSEQLYASIERYICHDGMPQPEVKQGLAEARQVTTAALNPQPAPLPTLPLPAPPLPKPPPATKPVPLPSMANKDNGQSGDPFACYELKAKKAGAGQWVYTEKNGCRYTVATVLNLCDADRSTSRSTRTCKDHDPNVIGEKSETSLAYTDSEPRLVRVCNVNTMECYNPPRPPR